MILLLSLNQGLHLLVWNKLEFRLVQGKNIFFYTIIFIYPFYWTINRNQFVCMGKNRINIRDLLTTARNFIFSQTQLYFRELCLILPSILWGHLFDFTPNIVWKLAWIYSEYHWAIWSKLVVTFYGNLLYFTQHI